MTALERDRRRNIRESNERFEEIQTAKELLSKYLPLPNTFVKQIPNSILKLVTTLGNAFKEYGPTLVSAAKTGMAAA